MSFEDFVLIKKFEAQFGGSIFHEEPGDRMIYEKDGTCYSLPDNFVDLVKQSIAEDKDYVLESGIEVEYDPEEIY